MAQKTASIPSNFEEGSLRDVTSRFNDRRVLLSRHTLHRLVGPHSALRTRTARLISKANIDKRYVNPEMIAAQMLPWAITNILSERLQDAIHKTPNGKRFIHMVKGIKGSVDERVQHVRQAVSEIVDEISEARGGHAHVKFVRGVYESIFGAFSTALCDDPESTMQAWMSCAEAQVDHHVDHVATLVAEFIESTIRSALASDDLASHRERIDSCFAEFNIGAHTQRRIRRAIQAAVQAYFNKDIKLNACCERVYNETLTHTRMFYEDAWQDDLAKRIAIDADVMNKFDSLGLGTTEIRSYCKINQTITGIIESENQKIRRETGLTDETISRAPVQAKPVRTRKLVAVAA